MKSAEEIVAYLHSTKPPWIAVLPSKDWVTTGHSASYQSDLSFIEIKGRRCQTKSSLLKHFAQQLRFPDYFGHNWDAFEECIRDLEWLPARGYVIVIVEADKLLSRSKPDLRTFVDIMNAAGEDWATSSGSARDGRKPFHTILVYRPDHPAPESFGDRSPVRASA